MVKMPPLRLLLLLLPSLVFSQEKPADKIPLRPPFTLKIVPLNLINTVQFSTDLMVDIPIAKRWALEMGLGYILDSWAHAPSFDETYRGIKIKPTLKYFVDRSAHDDSYVGLAFKYNYIENERYVNLIRQGFQYSETRLLRRTLDIWGLSIKAGSQLYMGKQDRWVIEPFGGFGFRQIRVSPYELPPDAEIEAQRGFIFSFDRAPGLYRTVDFMLGCNIGLAFRGRKA